MSEKKKRRFFIRNPKGEPTWAYCGELDDRGALVKAFGLYALAECEADMGGSNSDRFEMEIKVQPMTDAEVAALPDM